MPRKSITVTEQQDQWLKSQVESGGYRSEGEVISALIRERQSRERELTDIRMALVEAEKSGVSSRSPEDIREAVLKDMCENGELSTQ